MEGGPSIAVCELGGLGVRVDQQLEPVGGQRNQLVLALLSTAGPAGIHAGALVDSVWQGPTQPPTARRSLANIVSRFRAKFGADFIATTGDRYRLGPTIESERSLFLSLVEDAATLLPADPDKALTLVEDALLLWRGEPWAQLDSGWVDADRTFLISLHERASTIRARTLTELGRGLEAITIFEGLVDVDPLNEGVWHGLADALRSTGRRADALRAITRARSALAEHGLLPGPDLTEIEQRIHAESVDPHEPPSAQSPANAELLASSQLETLHACSSLWIDGHPDDAVEALLAGAEDFEPDVVRRLQRAVTVIPSTDNLARQLWAYGIRDWGSEQDLAHRWLISNDARALELSGRAGLATADAEVDEATTSVELIAALRVRFMVGLGHPLDEAQLRTVKRLGQLDDANAAVEASRFDALAKIKQGRLSEAVEALHRYAGIVADLWPNSDDDFSPMALHILGMHPDRERLGIPKTKSPSYPSYVADDLAARVSLAWHQQPASGVDSPTPYGFSQVLETTTADCADALLLRWHLRTNDLDQAQRSATGLAGRLADATRDRWFQAVPVALGEYAIRTGDRNLGDRAARALAPWAGEHLGLWPMDTFIGPAAHLLDDLAAI